MGCNAWNHPLDCKCGWGGDGHRGKSPGGWVHRGITNRGTSNPNRGSSSCQISRCPKCGDPVFFIRHNGGAVWLDPPLSPPWFKHPCFDNIPTSGERSNLLPLNKSSKELRNCRIGVVSSATKGELVFTTDNNKKLFFSVTGNPNDIVGEICAYNEKSRGIWALKNPKRVYSCIVEPPNISTNQKVKKQDKKNQSITHMTPCCACSALVKGEKRLVVHLRKVHKSVAVCIDYNIVGLMKIEEELSEEQLSKATEHEITASTIKVTTNRETQKPNFYLLSILRSALEATEKNNGWGRTDKIGSWIKKNLPDFKIKSYGYKNFREMVHQQVFLDVMEEFIDNGNTPITFIKLKGDS